MITLPPLGDLDDTLWLALIEIAERQPEHWTLVGGQMVLLHALEHGASPPRVSRDLDLVVDARVRPPALPQMVATLDTLGFSLGEIAPDGIGHRFVRGRVAIDVLAPDGLGERTDLRVAGGVETTAIAGGSYALSRSDLVEVSSGGRTGLVPRPDLAGAVLIKATAARADRRRGPERHLSDLVFLLSLVPDPFILREELGPLNSRRLGAVDDLADEGHEAWTGVDGTRRSDAMAAFTIVTGVDVAPQVGPA